jgi:hypothetical protein
MSQTASDIISELNKCRDKEEDSCETGEYPSDYCKWDSENSLCLKKCNKLSGNIDIQMKDIDAGNGEFLNSLTGLVENVSDISGCLTDTGVYKYLKQALIAKSVSGDSLGGICLTKSGIAGSLSGITIPKDPISIAKDVWGIGGTKLIDQGSLLNGTDIENNFGSPLCPDGLENPGTISNIYDKCMNDDEVNKKECCKLLFNTEQPDNAASDDGVGDDGAGDDGVTEGMFSVNLNPQGGDPLAETEILKINESNIDEIANCYLDNIGEVQKNKIMKQYTTDITYNIYENIPWYVTFLIIIICIYLCIIIVKTVIIIGGYLRYISGTTNQTTNIS